MANTYTQTNIHAVFAVKGRDHILHKVLMEELCRYMHGILANIQMFLIALHFTLLTEMFY